jgi:hypothetical protein
MGSLLSVLVASLGATGWMGAQAATSSATMDKSATVILESSSFQRFIDAFFLVFLACFLYPNL